MLRAKSILIAMVMTAAVLVGVNASISQAAVDTTFGTAGRVSAAGPAAAAVTSQGKIRTVAITGGNVVTVAELNPDGQPNLAWGASGVQTITVPGAPAVAPAPGQPIVFAGPSVVEVTGSGTLYAQFEVNLKAVVMKLHAGRVAGRNVGRRRFR